MKKLYLGILLVSFSVFGQNDVSKVGTTAGEILAMPASARGLALGNAVAGLRGDGSVFFWNPAAAALVTEIKISASYLPWLVNTDFQHFSFVSPVSQDLVIGSYIAMWSMDDMPVRTEQMQQGTGQYFDAGDLVLALSLARRMTSRFAIGVNVKYLQERIWHTAARGFALDFGTIYQTDILNGMKIITTLNNYGTDMHMTGRDLDILKDPESTMDGNNGEIPASYSTDFWSLPLNFRFGVATVLFSNEIFSIAMEIDALHPSNNYEAIDTGIEMSFKKILFLRAGFSSLGQSDSIEGLSIGGGGIIPLNNSTVNFDYGVRDFGNLGIIQAMTLGINL